MAVLKKFLALLLAMMMALVLASCSSDNDGKDDSDDSSSNSQGTTSTTKVLRSDDKYDYNFYEGMAEFTIPSGVTYLLGTFKGCTDLENVTIPSTVKIIGKDAFNGCTGLKSITIPSSVTVIGVSAFDGCTALTSITLNGTPKILEKAFNNCQISSMAIPASSASFVSDSGITLTSLTELKITGSVSSASLTAIKTLVGKDSSSGVDLDLSSASLSSLESSAFYQCTTLASVTLPSSVTSIGKNAFYGCSKLASINIPKNVKSIGSNAFKDCSALTTAKFDVTKGWTTTYKDNKVNPLGSAWVTSSDDEGSGTTTEFSESAAATALQTTYVANPWSRK